MTKDEAAKILHYFIIGLSKAGCSMVDIIEILQDRKVALCQLEESMSHINKEKHHDV